MTTSNSLTGVSLVREGRQEGASQGAGDGEEGQHPAGLC